MFSSVWKLKGLTGSESGDLELRSGHLIYTPHMGVGFDVPLTEVQDITFPWYYFGGGFKMRIGNDNYRFSFIKPHDEYANIGEARATGKAWKRALIG